MSVVALRELQSQFFRLFLSAGKQLHIHQPIFVKLGRNSGHNGFLGGNPKL
jgi:hypothetical protein